MIYPKLLFGLFAIFLATVSVSTSLAKQTEEVRAAELEELAKKAATPGTGLATILLAIKTADGLPPESPRPHPTARCHQD